MTILIKENERYTYGCEVYVKSKNDENFKIPMAEVVNIILKQYRLITYKKNRGNLAYRLLKASLYKEQYLILFFQFSNLDGSDPAFANLTTGKSRIIRKNQGEGVACSAHFIIDLKSDSPQYPNRFNAILEDMQGLSRSAIRGYLNHVVRNLKIQDQQDKNKIHQPKFDITFLAKNDFQTQLKEGKITSIIAFREEIRQSFSLDDEDTKIEYKEVHRLDFKPPSMLSNPLHYLANIAQFSHNEGYGRLKITHEKEHRQQSADYQIKDSLNDEEVIQDISITPFIAKKKVQLDKPINVCDYKWHSELIRKMLNQL
ncbi:hypothetical protein L5B97_00305 [Avibacterium sp. 20-15]|uniref:hypothetical protein n=1 Tax=unclassified Avibacterium TaxID=2685287 RepID=UPI002026F5BD|nr:MULTISPECIES: hypothetical protein [unclassified Avibacterium]MCW9731943.1 hypothetical protein [Avibacterium sp. 20-15]URL04132.1 hypothetical protein L4F93_11385 [Avibacterium sp. 20-132]